MTSLLDLIDDSKVFGSWFRDKTTWAAWRGWPPRWPDSGRVPFQPQGVPEALRDAVYYVEAVSQAHSQVGQ